MILEYATKELKEDKEMALVSVHHGGSLEFSNEEIRDDREIILAAVTGNGNQFWFASKQLREYL
jgi:hypothetical protein